MVTRHTMKIIIYNYQKRNISKISNVILHVMLKLILNKFRYGIVVDY